MDVGGSSRCQVIAPEDGAPAGASSGCRSGPLTAMPLSGIRTGPAACSVRYRLKPCSSAGEIPDCKWSLMIVLLRNLKPAFRPLTIAGSRS